MPPLGIGMNLFRPGAAARAENQKSPTTVAKPLISAEDLEVEYLNEISRLTKEKEDARDEIEKQSKDNDVINTSLKESNDSLQSKVAELEAKLLEVKNASEEKESSTATDVSTKSSRESDIMELEKMKAKLAKYHESNKSLSEKVRKLKQRRKDADDDASDISSVGSMISSQMSVLSSVSRYTNRLPSNGDKELQMKYEMELSKNKELEQKLHVVELNKGNSEKMLEELKADSARQTKEHDKEMEKILQDFIRANEQIAKLEAGSKETRDDTDEPRDKEINQVEADLEKSRQNSNALEKEIGEKKEEIELLKSKLDEEKENGVKIKELQTSVKQLEESISGKSKEIEILQKEKQESADQLQMLKSALDDSRAKSKQDEEELSKLRTMYEEEVEKNKNVENDPKIERDLDNKKETPVIDTEMKDRLNEIEEKYSKEVELSKSLKEELKKLTESKKSSDGEKKDEVVGVTNVLETKIHDKEKEIERITEESTQKEAALNNEIERLKEEITLKVNEEREQTSSALRSMENNLVESKLMNANQMEEILQMQDKYLREKQRCAELEENAEKNNNDQESKTKKDDGGKQIKESLKKISDLENTITKKDIEIKILEDKSKQLQETSEKLQKLEKELEEKTQILNEVNSEKNESTQRLETLELDFAVTQQKGAKTWEELEDLKDKFQVQVKEKTELQNKLKKMDSMDQLVGETKKLSEATLKQKDLEIEKIRRQLTEASMAKGAIEKKLVTVMNDSAAKDSTRELMKQELEVQLQDENNKADLLKSQIKAKENDIELVKKEFSDLMKAMQTQMEKKRNQVTELNGEVLEISNLLAMRERELEQLKGVTDDLELKHTSEVARLRKELEDSVDKVELERLRKQNSDYEYKISTLNQDLGQLRAQFVNKSTADEAVSQSPLKVLRARNDQLVKDVAKLNSKLRRIKKSRHEI